MIIDSSAVVAIILKEPGFVDLVDKLSMTAYAGIGAPTLLEAAIVLSARLKRDARGILARFIQEAAVVVVPFTDAHFGDAVNAWLRFGKGRHGAALNFGDCLAYATARGARQPLLCVGGDFAKTDVEIA